MSASLPKGRREKPRNTLNTRKPGLTHSDSVCSVCSVVRWALGSWCPLRLPLLPVSLPGCGPRDRGVRIKDRVEPVPTGGSSVAFTLIELLVVIAIIAILASLLLPTLSKAKAKAQSAACQSNQRQMGLALRMYLDDYNWYPFHAAHNTSEPWSNSLSEYVSRVSKVFVCPAHKRAVQTTNAIGFGDLVAFSYGYNAFGTGGSDDQGLNGDGPFANHVRESEVVAPSDMIAFGDSSEYEMTSFTIIQPTLGFRMADGFLSYGPSKRHSSGANILFCDGHVEYGHNRKWVEHKDDVMRRWNRDHEPHPETWTVNLLECP